MAELYLLRRHFGISATEANRGMPAWERELLIVGIRSELERAEQPAQDEPPPGGQWSSVPSELRGL